MSAPRPKRDLPRILVVTPEITYLPEGMGNLAQRLSAKAGGMADVSASLVKALHEQGADVHVALPNFRRMFHLDIAQVFEHEFQKVSRALPEQHIHLAEDRVFYHRESVYGAENHLIALAFQREVIHHIIPQVQPDLIHCNDWMTGLIPAFAREHDIPTLFTMHNIHTERMTLEHIEDRGIDAADFWQNLYYQNTPGCYEETRGQNLVDLLTSGIFSASHVNSVSPKFLSEVVDGKHQFVPGHIIHELWAKCDAGCATGILNAPDPIFDPRADPYLDFHYNEGNIYEGKRTNKIELQRRLGLHEDADAPFFYWPSRLDPVQKGCQLLTDILHDLTVDYPRMQIAIIANGVFKQHFLDIVYTDELHGRVAVHDFREGLSHRAYAAADFIFMPSSFEPCGLPQMVAPKYGALTLAHDTGGLHDTVEALNIDANTGNGILFNIFDSTALRWSIDEAMRFLELNEDHRSWILTRVMREARERFSHETTAMDYIRRYEEILGRPVTRKSEKVKKVPSEGEDLEPELRFA
ncbi:MAG: glycogen/starch synthase [Verrucomicrobiota bacterium]